MKTPRLVKQLKENKKVVFGTGKFDDWCVFVVDGNNKWQAPSDVEYFTDLKHIAMHYPKNKVYCDFVKIYEKTTCQVYQKVLGMIENIASNYNFAHQTKMEKWLTVIYAGMVAEENKKNAVLKKRIKRLGMYQVLVQGIEPETAANFSKGKKWRELDALMQNLGF